MISPVLDFGWFDSTNNPLTFATHLPSLTAAARDITDLDGRAKLADVEAYAAGPYIVDLLRGETDAAALARISDKVAGFTGLDPALVRKLGGRIDTATFERERDRAQGRVASAYDATVTGFDPHPHAARSRLCRSGARRAEGAARERHGGHRRKQAQLVRRCAL